MYEARTLDGYIPIGVVIASVGVLTSAVLLIYCTCCKKEKVPSHKAKVVKNVVAEEDQKTMTVEMRKKKVEPVRPRPGSMIFDNRVVGTGRWDDLSHLEDIQDDIPVKFRTKKPVNPLPPDVILHPSIRNTLLAAARNEIRPRSTIIRGTPSSPQTIHHYASQINVAVPANDAKPNYVNHTPVNLKKERPKSEYPLRNFPDVVEGSTDLSIDEVLYNAVNDEKKEINQSNQRRESRGRIQSSGDIPPSNPHEKLKRRNTPSDPGSLEGLPHRELERWGDNANPVVEAPPVPMRRYLMYKQDSEPNMMEQKEAWQDKSRLHSTPVNQSTRTHDPVKVPQNLPGYHYNSPSRDRYPTPEPRREGGRNPEGDSHVRENPANWSPRQQLGPTSAGGDSPHNMENPNWSPGQRPAPPTPGPDSVFMHGSDNMAYVGESQLPSQPVGNRDYRNGHVHPDIQYRQNRPPQHGDHYGYPPGQQPSLRQHQRHRRIDDLIHENHGGQGYDQQRRQMLPGVYLRPKPYYKQKEMQESGKRFSDASDYSDFMYGDSSAYYVDRVNRDFESNYFFRSRWSITPDAKPVDEMYQRRRNSDFLPDDTNYGVPLGSYVPPMRSNNVATPQQPINQRQQKQQYRRSLVELPDVDYESDIVRDHPKMRPRGGRNSRLSSGYQSQDSRRDFSSPENTIQAPRPPKHQSSLKIPHDFQHSHNTPPRINQSHLLPHASSSRPPMSPKLPPRRYSPKRQDSQVESPSTPLLPTIQEPPQIHPKLAKRSSSEYGDLIDVLYKYRQDIRISRQKDIQVEAPDSPITYEREKLREKLRKELSPRDTQSKNLDMVIEALLFLCENDNKSSNTRSWHRDRTSSRRSEKRPSSEIYLDHNSGHDDVILNNDVNTVEIVEDKMVKDTVPPSPQIGDVISVPSSPRISEITPPKTPEYKKRPRRHDYCEIKPTSPAPSTPSNDPPFPSVAKLDAILNISQDEPPIPPPRLKRKTKQPQETTEMAPPPSIDMERPDIIKDALTVEEEPVDAMTEQLYSKVVKRKRSSLPSLNFSSSELKWLQQTTGQTPKSAGFSTKTPNPPGQNQMESSRAKSTRVRRRSIDSVVLQVSPVRSNDEEAGDVINTDDAIMTDDDIKINFNEIINEEMDAEDVILAVERTMSPKMENKEKLLVKNRPSTPDLKKVNLYQIKRDIYSESDAGITSIRGLSGLPPSPHSRPQLKRSEGKYPSNDNTPRGSPANSIGFHTPPSRGSPVPTTAPPIPPRRGSLSPKLRQESLSPVKNYPVFYTPPPTPKNRSHNPVISPRISSPGPHYSSRTSSPLSSPKIGPSRIVQQRSSPGPHFPPGSPTTKPASPKLLPPSAVSQFTPRKTQETPKTPRRASVMISTPNTPSSKTPKSSPKLPFTGKKFVKSNSSEKIGKAKDSENIRVSRTGELIKLPADDDYAVPIDCIHSDVTRMNSPKQNCTSPKFNNDVTTHSGYHSPVTQPSIKMRYDVLKDDSYVTRGPRSSFDRRHSEFHSPQTSFNHSQQSRFYPIKEENLEVQFFTNNGGDYDDYAIPVNSPPLMLLKYKRSKSVDNMADYGSSV